MLRLRPIGTLKLRIPTEAADSLHQLLAFGRDQGSARLAEGVYVVGEKRKNNKLVGAAAGG